ncbi:MAG TPA: PAS domain S-box protein, partial [Nitrospira sp.]|nr:PAS domain S-box protein [Nitrospira sp.]
MAPKRTKKKQPVKGKGPFRGRAVGYSRRAMALSPTRKRAKIAASVDHQQLRFFIEQAPVAIAMLDREMRYLALSDRWKTDYGITGQALGRSCYEVFPEIPERWNEMYRRGLAGEIVSVDEDPFPRNDGSVQWTKWKVCPWYLGNEVGGITIMAEDVTLRVQARLALQENEERLRQVLEKTHTGMWDWEI